MYCIASMWREHSPETSAGLVDGDYTGSWEHVPREMRIMCWYYERRDKSLPFFSGLGFTTAAGAYYDGATLDNPKGLAGDARPHQRRGGHHVYDVAGSLRTAGPVRRSRLRNSAARAPSHASALIAAITRCPVVPP